MSCATLLIASMHHLLDDPDFPVSSSMKRSPISSLVRCPPTPTTSEGFTARLCLEQSNLQAVPPSSLLLHFHASRDRPAQSLRKPSRPYLQRTMSPSQSANWRRPRLVATAQLPAEQTSGRPLPNNWNAMRLHLAILLGTAIYRPPTTPLVTPTSAGSNPSPSTGTTSIPEGATEEANKRADRLR